MLLHKRKQVFRGEILCLQIKRPKLDNKSAYSFDLIESTKKLFERHGLKGFVSSAHISVGGSTPSGATSGSPGSTSSGSTGTTPSGGTTSSGGSTASGM